MSSPASPSTSSPGLSPKAVGIRAAIVTVTVWTAFIVIARASAGRSLTPFDITLARILGASLVLLPWGAWLVAQARRAGDRGFGSLFGLSPLPLRITALIGAAGGTPWLACGYLVATAVVSIIATLALKPEPLHTL